MNGTLNEHNVGFSPNVIDVAYAVAKTPQSTLFAYCLTEFITIFKTGSLQSNKAHIFFSTVFVILPLDKLSKIWQVLFSDLFLSELNTHIQCAEPLYKT